MKRERKNKDLGVQLKEHANKRIRQKKYEGNAEMTFSTGSTLLDLAISGGRVRGGGIPFGIMVVGYGPSGCVDCDTEFLSPIGWKKISEWGGEKVMQYNEDGTSEFVNPLNYIKKPANKLWRIKTKYGIDQCLSLDHNVAYKLKRKEGQKIYKKSLKRVLMQHDSSKYGFTGCFETVFVPKIKTRLIFNDDLLRVQVMFIADGHYSKKNKIGSLNLKKTRKVERAHILLQKSGIQYKHWNMSNGYVRFNFYPPFKDKEYDNKYYRCSLEQLKVISDEIFYWDGSLKYKSFSTTSEKTKDFIQYALASSGIRSSVYIDERFGRNTCYDMRTTKQHLVSMGPNKDCIKEYETIDGFQYSFTVPSNLLIFRRNHNIFITGNSGKTVLACEVAGEIQRKGGRIDYKDAEGRLNKPFAKIFDLDFDALNYSKPDIIPEAFKDLFENKHEDGKLYGYIVDSLAALSTSLEMENDEGDKMGGRRAKEFSMYLRKSKQIISKSNIILFCTNQIRENMDGGAWARKDVNPGGKAIEFYSSLILRFTKFKKIKESVTVKGKKVERVVGIEGTIEIDKSSIWKPHRTADIIIYFDYGIDDIRANLQFYKTYTGATVWMVGNRKLDRNIENAIDMIEEEGLENELKECVINLWEEIESKFEHERKKKKR